MIPIFWCRRSKLTKKQHGSLSKSMKRYSSRSKTEKRSSDPFFKIDGQMKRCSSRSKSQKRSSDPVLKEEANEQNRRISKQLKVKERDDLESKQQKKLKVKERGDLEDAAANTPSAAPAADVPAEVVANSDEPRRGGLLFNTPTPAAAAVPVEVVANSDEPPRGGGPNMERRAKMEYEFYLNSKDLLDYSIEEFASRFGLSLSAAQRRMDNIRRDRPIIQELNGYLAEINVGFLRIGCVTKYGGPSDESIASWKEQNYIRLSKYAVNEYNEWTNTLFEFEEVKEVKIKSKSHQLIVYDLTFEAKNVLKAGRGCGPQTFQAVVEVDPDNGRKRVVSCIFKPQE